MALMDHFAPNAGTDTGAGENGFERVQANGFTDLLAIQLNDSTQVDARAELLAKFPLDATDEAELDLILNDIFRGSPNSAAKQKEFRDLRATFVAYEGDFVTKNRAETNAGLPNT